MLVALAEDIGLLPKYFITPCSGLDAVSPFD
jgi:hypothetical protein